MKFPQRFSILPAFFANLIRPTIQAPSCREILRFLVQRGKEARAHVFIYTVGDSEDYREVRFHENPRFPLYYPSAYRWIDFCQTVDECFNPANWHHFLSPRFAITTKDTVVDCGAAEGLFTWYAANRGAKVIAFEPDEGFAAAMKKSFVGCSEVSIHSCALGERPGSAFLSRNEIFSRLGSEGQGTPIEVETLDNVLGEMPVTFIKADVEGHEFRVLLGAKNIIQRNLPRLALTMYHPQNNIREVMDFLRECHDSYQFGTKGIYDNGHPVMLQAWVEPCS